MCQPTTPAAGSDARCMCPSCAFNRKFLEIIESSPESHREFLRGVQDRLLDVEYNLDYFKAIHDGSFPQAADVLERAFKRVQAKVRAETTEKA